MAVEKVGKKEHNIMFVFQGRKQFAGGIGGASSIQYLHQWSGEKSTYTQKAVLNFSRELHDKGNKDRKSSWKGGKSASHR